MPGLVVLVMTLIGALLTAMVMAREWERGTLEALLVTPVRSDEILLGKTLPYFVLALVGFALCVLSARFLFHVPLRGSLWVLLGASMLYVLVALGIGLLISSWVKNQLVASQLTMLATFMPAFMLSGFLFDLRSMPLVVRLITYVLPARYYVALLQTVFLAGDVWSVIVPNTLVLAAMAAALALGSRAVMRKTLAVIAHARLAAAHPGPDAQGTARGAEGPAQPPEPAHSAGGAGADLRLRGHLRPQPRALRGAGPGPQRGVARSCWPVWTARACSSASRICSARATSPR